MKKFIYAFLTILVLSGIGVYRYTQSETDRLYPEKPIHIFYEGLATMPALIGIIDMIQLPQEEIKVFAWHRFPNRKDLVDLSQISATEIQTENKEGYVLVNGHKFIGEIKQILDKNPKSPVIVYTNLNNYKYFFDSFLPVVDRKRIKHIHLYEDGMGELLSFYHAFYDFGYTRQDIKDLENYYYSSEKEKRVPDCAKYMLHELFDLTYHFYGVNEVKGHPALDKFFTFIKDKRIKDIDFKEIANTMTIEQKEIFFKLMDFDVKYYENLFKNNKIFIFFGGMHFTPSHDKYHAEIGYLKWLKKAYPDHKFLFKPHPSYSSYDGKKDLLNYFPDMEIINPQLPYQVFTLAGLEADKYAGSASSLFYDLPQEKIVGYFPHEGYIKGLAEFRNIKDKAWDIADFVPQEPYFWDAKIIKSGGEDYLIFVNKTNAYLWYEKKRYGYKIVENNLKLYERGLHYQEYTKKDGVYHFVSGMNEYRLRHPDWSDTLVEKKDGKWCRLNDDCGKVVKKEKMLEVCWDKWGCETFIKQKDGSYLFEKK